MNTERNARFWVWMNGAQVKLTLKPGQRLDHNEYERHDEGFSSSDTAWVHTEVCDFVPHKQAEVLEPYVTVHYSCRSSDCDGRYFSSQDLSCKLDKLAVRVVDDWGGGHDADDHPKSQLAFRMPDWQLEDCEQRDYAAETAGY